MSEDAHTLNTKLNSDFDTFFPHPQTREPKPAKEVSAATNHVSDWSPMLETSVRDSDLVERCLYGDAAAWDQLVDKYGRLVYAIASYYQPSQAQAHAVFGRVFQRLLNALPRLRREVSLVDWLMQVAVQEAKRTVPDG